MRGLRPRVPREGGAGAATGRDQDGAGRRQDLVERADRRARDSGTFLAFSSRGFHLRGFGVNTSQLYSTLGLV